MEMPIIELDLRVDVLLECLILVKRLVYTDMGHVPSLAVDKL